MFSSVNVFQRQKYKVNTITIPGHCPKTEKKYMKIIMNRYHLIKNKHRCLINEYYIKSYTAVRRIQPIDAGSNLLLLATIWLHMVNSNNIFTMQKECYCMVHPVLVTLLYRYRMVTQE